MTSEQTTCDISALASLLDGSWGRSAEIAPGISVGARFLQELDSLVLTAVTTVPATPRTRSSAVSACVSQLADVLKDYVAKLKRDYKELAGSALHLRADTKEPTSDVKPLGITSSQSQYLVKISQTFSIG